jgi:hypothetical protein
MGVQVVGHEGNILVPREGNLNLIWLGTRQMLGVGLSVTRHSSGTHEPTMAACPEVDSSLGGCKERENWQPGKILSIGKIYTIGLNSLHPMEI